jgi:hypothetical protein
MDIMGVLLVVDDLPTTIIIHTDLLLLDLQMVIDMVIMALLLLLDHHLVRLDRLDYTTITTVDLLLLVLLGTGMNITLLRLLRRHLDAMAMVMITADPRRVDTVITAHLHLLLDMADIFPHLQDLMGHEEIIFLTPDMDMDMAIVDPLPSHLGREVFVLVEIIIHMGLLLVSAEIMVMITLTLPGVIIIPVNPVRNLSMVIFMVTGACTGTGTRVGINILSSLRRLLLDTAIRLSSV